MTKCQEEEGTPSGISVEAAVVVTMGAPESAVTPVLISLSANSRRKKQLVSGRQKSAELIRDETDIGRNFEKIPTFQVDVWKLIKASLN